MRDPNTRFLGLLDAMLSGRPLAPTTAAARHNRERYPNLMDRIDRLGVNVEDYRTGGLP